MLVGAQAERQPRARAGYLAARSRSASRFLRSRLTRARASAERTICLNNSPAPRTAL